MARECLRILTTTDFFGTYFPQPSSYGVLPGARALANTVERLRAEAVASFWIDTGDFSPGGPLSPVSAGTLGFVNAAALGIDAAVVGNHDLDWGREHLRRWAPELGFPLLAGNYDLGYPASVVLASGPWSVGIVGVTHPTLDVFNPTLPRSTQPMPEVVARAAETLRADGVDFVVAAVHDGVDGAVTPRGRWEAVPERMADLCRSLRGVVDAVLGGHTLQRWAGELAGVPFVQPWAFGAEVGVIDLYPGHPPAAFAVMVEGVGSWLGPGSRMRDALAVEVVGSLASPLTNAPGRDTSLLLALARGMLATTGAEAALVGGWDACFSQPPLDGAVAYLPAGPVSEADLLRTVPFAGDVVAGRVLVAEIRPDDLPLLEAGYVGAFDLGPPAIARSRDHPATLTVSEFHVSFAEQSLGRGLDWKQTGFGLRDALRAAVTQGNQYVRAGSTPRPTRLPVVLN